MFCEYNDTNAAESRNYYYFNQHTFWKGDKDCTLNPCGRHLSAGMKPLREMTPLTSHQTSTNQTVFVLHQRHFPDANLKRTKQKKHTSVHCNKVKQKLCLLFQSRGLELRTRRVSSCWCSCRAALGAGAADSGKIVLEGLLRFALGYRRPKWIQ